MSAVAASQAPADWTEPGVYPVAEGVFRIPLPLPTDSRLQAVNVYAIVQPDGFTLIDAGWALTTATSQLLAALRTLGASSLAEIQNFLITHLHRDHYTHAVALRREFGGRISLGIGERPGLLETARPDREPLAGQLRQLAQCGAEELIGRLRKAGSAPRDLSVWEQPDSWIDGVQDLALAGRTLHAVPTPGHTRGHQVFLDRSAGLLFAGDHVLPHITPSLGFEPVPREGALRDYLASLRLIREMPDAVLLPAHGSVLARVHPRVDELLRHHERRLDSMAAVIQQAPLTAYELAQRVTWTRRDRSFHELDDFNQMLATLETATHLDVLVSLGRATVTEAEPVRRYGPL